MNTGPSPIRGPVGRWVDESNRPYRDSILFQPRHAHPPPETPVADPAKYEAFLRQEQLARKTRWKRHQRQTLAWVLVSSALPILVVVLRFLFFR